MQQCENLMRASVVLVSILTRVFVMFPLSSVITSWCYIYIFDNSFIRSIKRRIKSVIINWRAGDYNFRSVFWIQVAEIICYNYEKKKKELTLTLTVHRGEGGGFVTFLIESVSGLCFISDDNDVCCDMGFDSLYVYSSTVGGSFCWLNFVNLFTSISNCFRMAVKMYLLNLKKKKNFFTLN